MSASALQNGAPATAEEVRRALAAVGEGAEAEDSWLYERWRDFWHWLRDVVDLPPLPGGGFVTVVLYVLLGLVVGWLAYRIAQRVRWRARAAQATVAPVETLAQRVERLLGEARAAEAAGDHVRALRLYFWTLVIGLSQRGDLVYRDAWTGREMLERGRPSAQAHARLAPLVPEIDRKSFGHEPASAADCARMAATCRELLGAR